VITREYFSIYVTDSEQRVLTRQHRAWVALYALHAGQGPRVDVLHTNDVTESDLLEFEDSWRKLRRRNPAQLVK
jgi:hypothetical protein